MYLSHNDGFNDVVDYNAIVFNWNHFEMRLLNLRINFYLLWTFFLILGSMAQRIEALSLYSSR